MTMTREQVAALLDGTTPGPWRLGSWGDNVFGTGPKDQWLPICRVKRDDAPLEESGDAKDARLIAAAPDLARQLLAAMDQLADADMAQAALVERAAGLCKVQASLSKTNEYDLAWCRCAGHLEYEIRALAPDAGVKALAELREERDTAREALHVSKRQSEAIAAELAEARKQVETYGDALEELKQWADAYPTKVFPEPDLARASAILSRGGMSLDVISASNMRHVLTRVAQIARAALAALPAPPGGEKGGE